jgi:branched-chain amino acid transport system permease protein
VLNLAHGAMFMLGGYAGFVTWQATARSRARSPRHAALGVLGIVMERVVIRLLLRAPARGPAARHLRPVHRVRRGGALVFLQRLEDRAGAGAASGHHQHGLHVLSDLSPAVVGICAVALLVLSSFLYRTRLGMIVRAGIEDSVMVDSLGINVDRVFMVVFGIGAMAAGFAGIINAPIVSLAPEVGEQILVQTFVVVVIGGVGSFPGAVLGGLIAGEIISLTSMVNPGYAYVMLFAADDAGAHAAAARPARQSGARVNADRIYARARPLLVEALTAAALIAAPFILPLFDAAPNTVNRILVWGLFGIGFDILFGYTGLLRSASRRSTAPAASSRPICSRAPAFPHVIARC